MIDANKEIIIVDDDGATDKMITASNEMIPTSDKMTAADDEIIVTDAWTSYPITNDVINHLTNKQINGLADL